MTVIGSADVMAMSSSVPAFHCSVSIACSHQAKARADWLHKARETCAVQTRLARQPIAAGFFPPERPTPIFRGRHDLASPHDFGSNADETLRHDHPLRALSP